MANDDTPSRKDLDRFLAGESTPEMDERILRWARSEPAWGTDDMWRRISAELESETLRPIRAASAAKAFRARGPRWRGAAIAAAAAIVLAVGILTVSRSAERDATPSAKEYRTERGQRASLKLADGSAVQLGPQSTLRIDPGYGNAARPVTLVGDGYFHVIHDADRPFVVRTALGEIRDLGTRFVIRARTESSEIEVAVAEGLVAIAAIGRVTDSLVVNAGELARLDRTGVSAPIRLQSVDDYFAWTEGRLVFDRTPVPQVLAELSRWYDTEFELADESIASTRLTTVLRGETLSEALLVLQNALDIDTRLRAGKVTLTKRSKTK